MRMMATERGPLPAVNGEPLIGVNQPVMALTEKAETLSDCEFAA